MENLKIESKKTAINHAIALRPYQRDCIKAINSGLNKNAAVLIQIPTGGGKTLIFNTFALDAVMDNRRALILVHREELLSQTIEKYSMIGGDKNDTGVIKQGRLEFNKLTVGMIQTVYKQLNKINLKEFDTVIVDEAHHSMASTWRTVIEHFKRADKKILGVTATPFRTDKQELKEIYDELVFKIDITDLMKLGHLAPIRGLMVYVDADYSKLKAKRDKNTGETDFTASSVERVLNDEEINAQIVQKWIELGENRKTIFFTISIKHAAALQNEFKKKGVSSTVVSSKLSQADRMGIIKDFKEGKVKVLVNVDILTEGFDDPSVECIALVRPTKSLSLYAQIIGRGLRTAAGKKDCLILDFTGRNRDMSIVGLGELFGLPEDLKEHIDKEGLSIGSVETDEFEERIELDGESSAPEKKRELKVLIGRDTKSFSFDSKEAMEYATKYSEDYYVLTCGKNNKVLSLKKEFGSYCIYLNSDKIKNNLADNYAWMVFTTLWKHYKDEFAEEFAKRGKSEPLTDKQAEILGRAKKAGLISELPKNKVDASNIISHLSNNGNAGEVLFGDGNGINYKPDKSNYYSPYRYEYKGVKLNIAHAFILAYGLKISAPKWISDLKKGLISLSVSEFKKIDSTGLKNPVDINIIEKLKSGFIEHSRSGEDVEIDDAKIKQFINYFKNYKLDKDKL